MALALNRPLGCLREEQKLKVPRRRSRSSRSQVVRRAPDAAALLRDELNVKEVMTRGRGVVCSPSVNRTSRA
jgi:hypothetical protein